LCGDPHGTFGAAMSGVLSGLKLVEFAGLGPAPFCGMLLADLGAEVTLVERHDERPHTQARPTEVFNRGKRSVRVDLKQPAGAALALRMIDAANSPRAPHESQSITGPIASSFMPNPGPMTRAAAQTNPFAPIYRPRIWGGARSARYATDTGIVSISPKVTMVIAQTRAGIVCAKAFKAKPIPTRA